MTETEKITKVTLEEYLRTDPHIEITIRMNPETEELEARFGFGNKIGGIYMDMDNSQATELAEEFVMYANMLLEQPDKFYAFVEYWQLDGMEIEEQIDLFSRNKVKKSEMKKMFGIIDE